jgi:flavorubredoxin
VSEAIKIKEGVYYIGVDDPKIRTFDIIMKTANGSTYNSYVVRGSDGVAILDTVKKEFQDEFFEKLESLCEYDEINYIIFNHLELDHTGALPELLKRARNAKVIISTTGKLIFEALTRGEVEYEAVYSSKSISLGDKTLEFLSTPYLHWPDTMSTYLKEDRILFSGDVFGSHFYDERLFDDKVGEFEYAFKYYYDHIMRPFKKSVLQALKLYERLEIDMIAPLHGPILRTNPSKYIESYKKWSSETKFSKKDFDYKHINIFYISSYGNTQEMAEAIYKGVDSVEGIRASMYDMSSLEPESIITLLEESDGVLIGSPTINGDAVKPVWDLLSYMCYIEKSGKIGAVFGSYGWSGEAFDMVQSRLKGLKFRVPLSPMKIKLNPTEDDLKNCFDFGVELAEIANGKMIEMTL